MCTQAKSFVQISALEADNRKLAIQNGHSAAENKVLELRLGLSAEKCKQAEEDHSEIRENLLVLRQCLKVLNALQSLGCLRAYCSFLNFLEFTLEVPNSLWVWEIYTTFHWDLPWLYPSILSGFKSYFDSHVSEVSGILTMDLCLLKSTPPPLPPSPPPKEDIRVSSLDGVKKALHQYSRLLSHQSCKYDIFLCVISGGANIRWHSQRLSQLTDGKLFWMSQHLSQQRWLCFQPGKSTSSKWLLCVILC